MSRVHYFKFVLILATGVHLKAQPLCADLFKTDLSKTNFVETAKQPARLQSRKTIDPKQFEDLSVAIALNSADFQNILAAIDNPTGAKYETEQVIKTLRGIRTHEMAYLNNIQGVRNVAVYGSTNIPLYTLILHAVIPASTGAEVWFRTPQLTRDIYVRLFEKLKAVHPEFAWDKIHLLTEKRDVQYENFRKLHVLGLNLNGTRFLRAPSEVVLFTGSPKTGDEVLAANKRKLEELLQTESGAGMAARQIFLKFGSGLNPVVVTEHATGRLLDQAVDGTITAVKVNASQDCIAPKVYFVHLNASKKYFESLSTKLSALKFGSNLDLAADYGPITFTEDFAQLQAFKEKWIDYLVTPDAVLDPTTKRVDPHVFSVPFSKLKELDLVDHFAPFLVHVTYSHPTELAKIATDSRLRERAMFASIYGQASNTEMVGIRKLFEETFHTTVLNQSIFAEESGNFPFGGYSPDASSVTQISIRNAKVSESTTARPLLFSQEAARAFPKYSQKASQAALQVSESERAESIKTLSEAISSGLSNRPPRDIKSEWYNLHAPLKTSRPRGLRALRKIIDSEGLYIANNSYATRDHAKQLFDSDRAVYKGGAHPTFKPMSGVMLHPAFIGASVATLNQARGRINPHLGVGYLHAQFSNSKSLEYHLANAVRPGSMPRSLTLEQTLQIEQHGKKLSEIQNDMANLVRSALSKGPKIPIEIQSALIDVLCLRLEDFFMTLNTIFPEGAYLKNYGESTTGDLGNQITSFTQNARGITTEFVESLALVSKSGSKQLILTASALSGATSHALYKTGFKFLAKLITEPNQILIQQRVKLAKTSLGLPVEIRVDFIDGEAVLARPRYTSEYLRPEMDEAIAFLNSFFADAPEAIQYLAGGADIAKLEDGRWVFMEFNFGSNSGTLHASLFPIESHLFISRLQGKKTPLIKMLDTAFYSGPEGQNIFLKSLKTGKEKWNKSNMNDLSVAEVARYFRDRALDQFRKRPTRFHAEITLKNIQTAFANFESNEAAQDLQLLRRGAEDFMARYFKN